MGKSSLQVKKQPIYIFRIYYKEVKQNDVFKSSKRNQMLFDLKISSLHNSIHWCSMDIFTTLAIVVSYISWKDQTTFFSAPVWASRSVKSLGFSDEDAKAIWKHCHQQHHTNNTHNFRTIGNSINNYHFQLNDSLSILKLKMLYCFI